MSHKSVELITSISSRHLSSHPSVIADRTQGYFTHLSTLSPTPQPFKYLLNLAHQSDQLTFKNSTSRNQQVSGRITLSQQWDRSGWAGWKKRRSARWSVKMNIGGEINVAYERFPSYLESESRASYSPARAGPGAAGSD